MRKIFLPMFFLLLLAMPTGGIASPSINGSTGNIETPSADVLRSGQVSLGWYRLEGENKMVTSFGLGGNWELSLQGNADRADDRTEVNLKYAVQQENVLEPGLAVGIEDAGKEEKRTVYAVASKALPLGLRVHAGYGNGRYDGVFYAVEKKLVKMSSGGSFPDASLIIENDGQDINYGLRLSLSRGLKATAGWRRHESFVGITYNYY